MDIERLVKTITLEVLKHINRQEVNDSGQSTYSKKILFLTEENHPIEENVIQSYKTFCKVEFIEDYYVHRSLESYEAIVIASLSTKLMVNIALGIRNEGIEEIIAEAILRGKSIYILEEGIIYKEYKTTSNPNFFQMMEDYESRLYGFGICNVDQNGLHERISGSDQYCNKNSSVCTLDKKIVTEADIEECFKKNITVLHIPSKTMITPLAIDYIKHNKLAIIRKE